MRSISLPDATTDRLFELGLPTVAPARRARLARLRSRAANEETVLIGLTSVREYAPPPMSATEISDMKWFYKTKVRAGPGLPIAERLLLGADGFCAYCEEGSSRTLDHAAGKSAAALLAATPVNLVPACRDCNDEMNAVPIQLSLNLYFDAWVEKATWLHAAVADASHPQVMEFRVRKVDGWTDQQNRALDTVVTRTGMLTRYALLASAELPRLAKRLHRVAGRDARAAVKFLSEELQEELERGRNHRRYAALREWRRLCAAIDWCSIAGCRGH